MTDDSSVGKLQDLLARSPVLRPASVPIERGALVDALDTAIRAGRLTVFVGAGLSYATGLPTWNALLDRLAKRLVPAERREALAVLARYDSPLVVARYLKTHLAVEAAFHTQVRAALYDGDIDYELENPTLDLLIAIVERAAALGSRVDIVTYNFDDLIETSLALRCPEISVASIASAEEFHCARENIRVLHVHGILHRAETAQVLPPPLLVLSEDEFHRLMSDAAAWQNRTQADALAWRDCLFLGLSMTDPNLRRIIDYAASLGKGTPRSRWIVARRYASGDTIAPGEAPMNADTADALNGIKDVLYTDLAAQVHYLDGFTEFHAITEDLNAIPA